jgi:hypothetical protein
MARMMASEGLADAAANAAAVKPRFDEFAASAREFARSADAGKFTVTSRSAPLDFEMTPRPQMSIPEDQGELRIRIGRVLTVLQILFRPRPRRLAWLWRRRRSVSPDGDTFVEARAGEYRDQLLGIAKLGLEADPAQVRLAGRQLDEFQTQIVAREAATIKNAYMRRFLGYTLATVLLFLALFLGLRTLGTDSPLASLVAYQNVLLLLCGASFGAWLSFGMRKVVLGFGDLAALEEDRLDPPIRLVFVCGLSVIVTLLFVIGAVSIAIGSFATKPLESVPAALLIGLFCGVSEQALSLAVGKRASEFMAGVAAGGGPGPAPPP